MISSRNDGAATDAGYNARLTKASLKVPEARLVAQALLSSSSPNDAINGIVASNLLSKRNPSTSRTLGAILVTRLASLESHVWSLVADGSPSEATAAVLAGAVKAERLLADYMDSALRESIRTYSPALDPRAWGAYIEGCAERDPVVATWTQPVLKKLRQNTFRILAEAGYVADTRSLRLQRVHVPEPVVAALETAGEQRILNILRVAE